MHHDFVKKSDMDFALQLTNFSNKLGNLKETLGLTDEDVSEAAVASDYFKYVLDMHVAHTDRIKNWTSYKDHLRKPGVGHPAVSAAPVTLTVPPAPDQAPMGIENWFRLLVRRIKGSKNYTESIGQDLGIVAVNTGIDTVNVKPSLKVELVAGQPLIIWKKGQMDGIEIFKDSGNGGWIMLKYDQRPNHLDTSALPAVGVSANWKYKAIYRYQDARVGNWSDEVNVVVSGSV